VFRATRLHAADPIERLCEDGNPEPVCGTILAAANLLETRDHDLVYQLPSSRRADEGWARRRGEKETQLTAFLAAEFSHRHGVLVEERECVPDFVRQDAEIFPVLVLVLVAERYFLIAVWR
jgi:hypothetical protein